VINCSVTRAGDKSSNATLALGSVLIALAGVLARRRRRIARTH
jgi:LPXTG-motif cell wall-anchored protein